MVIFGGAEADFWVILGRFGWWEGDFGGDFEGFFLGGEGWRNFGSF